MKRNLKIYISFSIIIMAMGFLIFSGFNNESMLYYSTVKELKMKSDAIGQGFRVSGTVVAGSVIHASDRLQVQFEIEEEGERLLIVYDGVLPDTFKEDVDVLVEGKYQGNGKFVATNVLTKCASKYDPQAAGAQKLGAGQSIND